MDISGPVPESFQKPLLVLGALCIAVGAAEIGIGAVVYAQLNETTSLAFGAWWGSIAVVVGSNTFTKFTIASDHPFHLLTISLSVFAFTQTTTSWLE